MPIESFNVTDITIEIIHYHEAELTSTLYHLSTAEASQHIIATYDTNWKLTYYDDKLADIVEIQQPANAIDWLIQLPTNEQHEVLNQLIHLK